MATWKTVKLGDFLTPYRIEHTIRSDQDYRQVTISKSGNISLRGVKSGSKIGRKRQFQIDLIRYPNTVLFTRQGLLDGAIGIAPSEIDGCVVTENMPMMSVNTDVVSIEYLRKLLVSDYFFDKVRKLKIVGSAQKSIHERDLLQVELDLPEKNHQLETIKKFIVLDSEQAQLVSELAHQQTLLKKLRQQILQEAIEGKLTADWRSQNPDIEPASKLLKRIATEKAQLVKDKKIKPQKPLPPIKDEEKPFELPKGWEWCRLDQLIYESPRNGYSPKTVDFPTNIKTLKLGATTSGKFDATEIKYIDEEIAKDSFLWIKNRDILIQRANSIDFVGVSAIYYGKENCFIYPDLMMKLKPVSSISEIYLHHTLMSFSCREYFRKNATGSQKSMPKINQNVVSSTLIPLCSKDEQQAIVAKVEKLLAICDQLETQITQNQTHAEQLMQAVLKEAFNHNSESRG